MYTKNRYCSRLALLLKRRKVPYELLRRKFEKSLLHYHLSGKKKPDVKNAMEYCQLMDLSLEEFYAELEEKETCEP